MGSARRELRVWQQKDRTPWDPQSNYNISDSGEHKHSLPLPANSSACLKFHRRAASHDTALHTSKDTCPASCIQDAAWVCSRGRTPICAGGGGKPAQTVPPLVRTRTAANPVSHLAGSEAPVRKFTRDIRLMSVLVKPALSPWR